jgi:hypothetical protein
VVESAGKSDDGTSESIPTLFERSRWMNRKRKKLTLSTETVRNLSEADYKNVAGGTTVANTDCSAACSGCTRLCTACTRACSICCL